MSNKARQIRVFAPTSNMSVPPSAILPAGVQTEAGRNPLIRPTYVRNLLQQHSLILSRKKGQNLLIDGNVLAKIVAAAELQPGDGVLEIGAGLGTLTLELCRRAGRVVAVEWDRRLTRLLAEHAARCRNLVIIEGDILKMDLVALGRHFAAVPAGGFKVVSNLPFSVAAPVLLKLLESRIGIEVMLCLVQKEVGERIVSPPGSKDYGFFSVLSQMYSRPRLLFRVKGSCFFPSPHVDSVMVRFQMLPSGACAVKDRQFWRTVVEAAFARRRKTLKNALAGSPRLGYTASQIIEACARARIDPVSRAEELSVEDLARLSDAFQRER